MMLSSWYLATALLLAGQQTDVTQHPPRMPDSPVTHDMHAMADNVNASGDVILPGYGGGALEIATAVPQAQAFFNNGLQLAHAFSHKAAIAAFAHAVKLDPQCAMCLWGEAWASGPNINFGTAPEEVTRLETMALRAQALATNGPARERALTAALVQRYRDGGGTGRGDHAFARAMDAVARAYPDDDELAVLTADAWMIPSALHTSRANLPRAIELLEGVLKRHPDFTPAIHFYIHATEMSGFPARAEPFANRLAALAPAASHLNHMPSHTDYWVGRYQDAVDANMRAVAIDVANARRMRMAEPGGVWKLTYHPHNVQFGAGAALLSGDAKSALALSEPFIAAVSRMPKPAAYMQMGAGTGYFAMGRFATPAAVLALADPGAERPYLQAYRHYARGEVYARMGNAAGVRQEAAQIPDSVGPVNKDDMSAAARGVMRISRLVLLGRAAMLDQQPRVAARAYRKAIRIEESSLFTDLSDPPAWWYPVRRSLGAALLADGRPAAALEQANAALQHRPLDPVTTMLRAQAEIALGQTAEGARDEAFARSHWRGDDSAFEATLL